MHFLIKTSSIVALIVATALPAYAILLTPQQLSTPGVDKTLILPPAADNSPVIYLGSAVDPQSGEVVKGYAIVHHKNQAARTSAATKGGPTCYGYLARSPVKWKSVEPWVVNAANMRALASDFVLANLSSDISKWEDAADGIVGNSLGADILGEGSLTTDALVADTSAPDGLNEVYFADIEDSSAIAVTIVWGVFGGPPSGRKLVEWEQIYDDTTYDWSATGEAGKMDFENIATHELGHSVGLGDIYDVSCADVTMYGYATEGEISKRDLAPADVTGINKLY